MVLRTLSATALIMIAAMGLKVASTNPAFDPVYIVVGILLVAILLIVDLKREKSEKS